MIHLKCMLKIFQIIINVANYKFWQASTLGKLKKVTDQMRLESYRHRTDWLICPYEPKTCRAVHKIKLIKLVWQLNVWGLSVSVIQYSLQITSS